MTGTTGTTQVYERAKLEGERAKAEVSPAKPPGGAKRKAAPVDRPAGETSWEETCPEFGEGWTRRSRQRAGSSGLDHTYVSPAGKPFPSRIKVVQHLGLGSDPGSKGGRRLSEEEREERLGARQQKEKQKVSQKQLLKDEALRLKAQQKDKDKVREKARKQQARRDAKRGGRAPAPRTPACSPTRACGSPAHPSLPPCVCRPAH